MEETQWFRDQNTEAKGRPDLSYASSSRIKGNEYRFKIIISLLLVCASLYATSLLLSAHWSKKPEVY